MNNVIDLRLMNDVIAVKAILWVHERWIENSTSSETKTHSDGLLEFMVHATGVQIKCIGNHDAATVVEEISFLII